MIFRTEEEFDPALAEFAKVFSKIPRRRPTNPSMPTLTTLRACAVELRRYCATENGCAPLE
jgi:hypothetical protein